MAAECDKMVRKIKERKINTFERIGIENDAFNIQSN